MAETAETQKSSSLVYNSDELKKVFDQFDTNKDGKLSITELRNVMKAMGSSFTELEMKRAMEDIDADHDGFIDISEFKTICGSTKDAANADNDIRDAFDLYDQDKNGLISSTELHSVLSRLGVTCSVEDCCRMIQSVDSDGDGNVNFQEFQKMMSKSLGGNK